MRTDYQNINKFEVGIVCAIAIGFLIVGSILFSSLTPRQQAGVESAIEMFDIHKQAIETFESVKFVWGIPNEFYQEFYIAFTQVATMPEETLIVPLGAAKQLYTIAGYAFGNLADQASSGYAAQNNFHIATLENRQLAYDGKVLGTAIQIADKLSEIVVEEKPRTNQLDFHYSYKAQKINLQITRLVERAKISN